jgi:glutamate carboxypeptidase
MIRSLSMDLTGAQELAAGRAEAMRDRLREYVECETPTGDEAALDALADRLAARYRALGGDVSRSGNHVVVHFPGRGERAGEAPLLFLGHHDTVHPVGHLAGPMPWRERDGIIHGPGVFDMKGGLVVLETAYAVVEELELSHRPVHLVVVADEEIGSPSARDLITAEADGVAAAFGLEPPHRDGALKTARRGSTRVRIAVTGRESHAGLDPQAGVSAIDELVDQLLALRQIVAQHNDVLCNVGTIAGGGRTNVVPGEASADVGLRFAGAGGERAVLDRIGALTAVRAGATVRVEVMSSRPAWGPSEQGDALLAAVRRAARSVGQEVTGAPASGAADTNQTGWLGVPSLDGLGPIGQGAHALHEQIVAASLPDRATLVAAIIATL